MNLMTSGLMSSTDQVTVDAIVLFTALLCVCIVIGHLLEENRWFNESITAVLIGLATGCIILLTSGGTNSRVLQFNEELFFIYLLPPIIFNAGFQVKKKQFFRNFMTIVMYGAIGTLISFSIISFGASLIFKQLNIGFLELADYPAIGAILSATDSVCTLQVLNQDETPLLYSLVFGEGVVNDATSVVIFNAIRKLDLSHLNSSTIFEFFGNLSFLFIASTLLGIVVGLFSAYIIKKLYFGSVGAFSYLSTDQLAPNSIDNYGFLLPMLSSLVGNRDFYRKKHSTDREVALMALMAYLSYVMAELYDLSGILTVFFCGIVMSHYTWHNVTDSSRVTTKHGFATMSFIAEIFIFLYVGMDALDVEKWRYVSNIPGKSIGASAMLLGLVLLGRAAFVFPLSFLINLTKRSDSDKINFKQQVTIWWAGLMRGAVSMALAYTQFTNSGRTRLPGHAFMITSTITIVLFSTLVFGMLTKPLVRFLLPQSAHVVSSEPSSPKSFLLPLLANGHGPDEGGDTQPLTMRRPSSVRMLLNAHTIHYYWRKFDDAFMRPVFGGRGFMPNVPGTPLDRSMHPSST